MSCVTKIKDISKFFKISTSSLRDAGSRFELGSSSTKSSGFEAKTEAIATFHF